MIFYLIDLKLRTKVIFIGTLLRVCLMRRKRLFTAIVTRLCGIEEADIYHSLCGWKFIYSDREIRRQDISGYPKY